MATAVALTLSLGSVAMAETYRTPGNEVAVGTNGSDARAGFVGISERGCATGYAAVTVGESNRNCNHPGTCSGYPSCIAEHEAHGTLVSLGLLGAESGGPVSVSESGNAYACRIWNEAFCLLPGVAVSGTGNASGYTAASGTGNASGDTNSLLAVSGTGNATGSQMVGVSLAGNASGRTAAVTVAGNASGPTSVDVDREVGTAKGTVHAPLEATGLWKNYGVAETDSASQLYNTAKSPTPDPMKVAAMYAKYQELSPVVARRLAGLDDAPASPEHADSAESQPVPMSDFLYDVEDAVQGQYTYGCVPQSVNAAYVNHGAPGNEQLHYEMGADKNHGTTLEHGAAIMRRHYTGEAEPIADVGHSPVELMTKIVADISEYGQGTVLSVNPALLDYDYNGPVPEGSKPDRPAGNHAITAFGYFFVGSTGFVFIVDGEVEEIANPMRIFELKQLFGALTNQGVANIIW